jgi:hypothetical protein
VHLDVLHLGACRALDELADKRLDGILGSGDQRLDGSVGAVADPAIDAELGRFGDDVVAVADALDTALDAEAEMGGFVAHHANMRTRARRTRRRVND